MAKPKDADVKAAEGQGVEGETLDMLEGDVKQGKARKFILIYKGATIKKLIVFKKGPYQSRLQKAKTDGFKGDAVCGVVTGAGDRLTFQLAGNKEVAGAMSVDVAVDEEPTTAAKLRDFLKDNKLSRKPEYQIIRDVAAFTKPDDDGVAAPTLAATTAAPVTPAKAASTAASTAAPQKVTPQKVAPAADGAPDAALAAKIKKLKDTVLPKVKDAAEADPSRKAEIAELLKAATTQEKDQIWGDAFNSLKKLAETIKDVFDGGVSNKEFYEQNLAGAELKVKTLKDHPQSAAIKADVDKLSGYLEKAKEHAKTNNFLDATLELKKILDEYPPIIRLADTLKLARSIESGLVIQFNNFKLHQGIDAIGADKVKEIGDKIASLDGLIKARKFGDFDTTTADVNGKMDAYKIKANRHGDYVGLRSNALLFIESLEAHPNKEAIKDKIATIKKDLIDKAKVEYETNNSYEKARALLDQVEAKCQQAKKLADDTGQADFTKEIDAAKLRIKELEKPEKKNPQVDAEVAAIQAKIAMAEKYAAAKQYPDATKLLDEIKKALTAAEKLATEQAGFKGDEKSAGDALASIDTKSQEAVDAVQKMHDRLGKHPHAPVITFELGEVQKTIDEAKAALK